MGKYQEYRYKVFIHIHQLKNMSIKRIVDRAENFLLSLSFEELLSLSILKDSNGFSMFSNAGPPGIYFSWDTKSVFTRHLGDKEGNTFWRDHVLKNNIISVPKDGQMYGGPGSHIVWEMSFDFNECQGFACPFKFIPTHLNIENGNIRTILTWRLSLGG